MPQLSPRKARDHCGSHHARRPPEARPHTRGEQRPQPLTAGPNPTGVQQIVVEFENLGGPQHPRVVVIGHPPRPAGLAGVRPPPGSQPHLQRAGFDDVPDGDGQAAAQAAPAQGADLTTAVAAMTAAIEKANAGYALLTTNVQGLMSAVGGQSRDPSAGGRPPVEALFKASPPGKEAEINRLFGEGAISAQDRDKGIDALGYQRVAGVPESVVKASIDACAPPVQAILRAAA